MMRQPIGSRYERSRTRGVQPVETKPCENEPTTIHAKMDRGDERILRTEKNTARNGRFSDPPTSCTPLAPISSPFHPRLISSTPKEFVIVLPPMRRAPRVRPTLSLISSFKVRVTRKSRRVASKPIDQNNRPEFERTDERMSSKRSLSRGHRCPWNRSDSVR
jgi:hypothetical protein